MDSRVTEHVDAFNAHDTDRLLRGLAEDAVWTTGQDTFRGHEALAALFDAGLWELGPSLELRTLVADEGSAAAELMEQLTRGRRAAPLRDRRVLPVR